MFLGYKRENVYIFIFFPSVFSNKTGKQSLIVFSLNICSTVNSLSLFRVNTTCLHARQLLITAEWLIKSGNKMAAADKNQYVPAFGEPHPLLVQLHSEEKYVLSSGKNVAFTLNLTLN